HVPQVGAVRAVSGVLGAEGTVRGGQGIAGDPAGRGVPEVLGNGDTRPRCLDRRDTVVIPPGSPGFAGVLETDVLPTGVDGAGTRVRTTPVLGRPGGWAGPGFGGGRTGGGLGLRGGGVVGGLHRQPTRGRNGPGDAVERGPLRGRQGAESGLALQRPPDGGADRLTADAAGAGVGNGADLDLGVGDLPGQVVRPDGEVVDHDDGPGFLSARPDQFGHRRAVHRDGVADPATDHARAVVRYYGRGRRCACHEDGRAADDRCRGDRGERFAGHPGEGGGADPDGAVLLVAVVSTGTTTKTHGK